MEEVQGDQGVKISPPAPPVKTDYRRSDAELLDLDPNAPELGDLTKGTSQAAPKVEPKAEVVELDDENQPIVKAPEEAKAKEPEVKDEEDEEELEVKTPEAEEKAKKAEDEVEPLAPLKVTEELKSHFADPKVGRELKNAFYGYQAYKEAIPSVEDAREFARLFPTIEDAREVMETYDGFSSMQDDFEKNPKGFVEKLHEEGEPEFVAIAEELMTQLPELAPGVYNKLGRQVFVDGLQYIYAEAETIAAKASRQSNLELTPENLRVAADVIALNLFGGKKVVDLDKPLDERDSRIQQLETELQTEKASKVEAPLRSFVEGVDQYIEKRMNIEIDSMIDLLLEGEGSKEAVTPKSREKIKREIYQEVKPQLLTDKRLGDRIKAAAKSGDYGSRHMKKTAEPALEVARLAIKAAAKKIVPEWTREIIQTNTDRLNQQRSAARRPDIASGGPKMVVPQTAITPDQIDYSRTSAEDILEGRIALKSR
jgi:hypothetical protein